MLDVTKLNPQEQAQLSALLAIADASGTATPRKRARKKETIKYLSEEQIELFFRAIKSVRDVAIFRVIYHRGLRASELGELQLSDWRRDRNPNRIRFSRKKGSDGGEYMLTSKEVRALRAWLRTRGDAPGPLFPSRKRKGISQQMLDVLMKRYGKLVGLPPELCHTHSLKHTCATHLLNKGLSIEDVQDHLGHKNIQSTLVYAKYSSQRRAARDARLRDW